MKETAESATKNLIFSRNFETLPLGNRPQGIWHLPQAQRAPKFTRLLGSWNLSEKIFCLQYFPFWMSKLYVLQAKFVTSGMKYRIPTSCGNHMFDSSANDGRFQLILAELKTGNRALCSSLQDVCIEGRQRKKKSN